jgi:hypothetical protein
MRPEVIDYVLAKLEAELTSAEDGLSGELQQMRRRKQERTFLWGQNDSWPFLPLLIQELAAGALNSKEEVS